MIHRSADGSHLVRALRQATSNIGIQITVGVGFTVQCHKECELGWICGCSLVERFESLDDDVRMPLNETSGRIKLLRCCKVVRVWIDKVARRHVPDSQCNLKGAVRWDDSKVRGRDKLGARHVGGRWDRPHRGRVAGAILELLAIGDGKVRKRSAPVNEVVGGRK